MATFPALWSSDTQGWVTYAGLYTKFPSYPAVDTALLDINAATIGFQRIILTSGGVLYTEAQYHGGYCRANLTPHLRLLADHWYWVEIAMGSTDGSKSGAPNGTTCYGLVGQVFQADGTTDGPQGVFASPGAHHETANCDVGLGVSLDGAYGHQHNEAGRLIAQLRLGRASSTLADSHVFAGPTADLVTSTIDGAYYPAREAVGPSPTLADVALISGSSTHLTMDSGPNGLTIVRDSPY